MTDTPPSQANQPSPSPQSPQTSSSAPAAGSQSVSPSEIVTKFEREEQRYDLAKSEDRDLLVRRAQLGQLYEKQQSRLKEMQASLAAKQSLVEAGEKLERFRQSNPREAAAVRDTIRALSEGRISAEQVMAAIGGQTQSQPESGEAPTRADVDAPTRAYLATLEERQRALDSELNSWKKTALHDKQMSEIERALQTDDFLRDKPKTKELVAKQIQAHIDGGADLHEAVLRATTQAREMLGEAKTAERDQRLANQELRTVSPSQGVPPTRLPKLDFKADEKMSPRDRTAAKLKAITNLAREAARNAMRNAVSGPSH